MNSLQPPSKWLLLLHKPLCRSSARGPRPSRLRSCPLARRGGGAVPAVGPRPVRPIERRVNDGESKLPSLASRCLTVCYGACRQVSNTLKRILWGGYKPKCRYGNQFCLSASENNVRESLNIFFSFETKNRLSRERFGRKNGKKTSLIRGCLLLFR